MAETSAFRYRGIAGLGVSLIAGRASQALAFVLMARFLTAPQMGQVAIFTAIFLGLYQLTNLGFDRYIIYAKVEGKEELDRTIDGVWSLQIARGVLVLLLVLPIYFVLGLFPDLDISLNEILVIGVIICAFSLATPELSTFERTGDFSSVSKARGSGLVVGALVTSALVIFWSSPWVYLVGQLVNGFLFAALSHRYSKRMPHLQFNRARIGKIWEYSRHLVVIAAVSFISTQAQNIYVGASFGAATLGMYFTWYRLVSLPGEFITQMQDRLLYAKANDASRREQDAGMIHLLGFGLTIGLLVPFYLFVWFHGDSLMTLLATDRWISFWWVGKMFVLISLLFNIAGTMTPFLLVKVPHITSRLRVFESLLGFALILLLGPIFGVAGVLSALLFEITVAAIARVFLLYRYIINTRRVTHMRSALFIVTAVSTPILVWERLASEFSTALLSPYFSALFYAFWVVILAGCVFLRRRQIMTGLTS